MTFKAIPSEHAEQASFFDSVLFQLLPRYPEIHPLLFSVPNGSVLAGDAKRRAQQMSKLKREGLTPGVADVLFLSGRGGYLGLAMEFKTVDRAHSLTGGLSEAQREFLTAAKLEGYRAEPVYGVDHAERVFNEYLNQPKTQELVYNALRCLEKGEIEEAKNILRGVTLSW